jgi:hypothetical protein
MKLKELNEAIATACDVQPKVVGNVLTEAFRQIRATVQKGEKVTIPEFGIFVAKDVAAENGEGGARASLRFRERSPEEDEKKKAKRAEKKAKKAAEAGSGDDGDQDGDED